LIAYISIVIRHEFTLVLVGGIFVAEALSVVIQVYYFKYTRNGAHWTALSVSPASRIQNWFWNGTSWGN